MKSSDINNKKDNQRTGLYSRLIEIYEKNPAPTYLDLKDSHIGDIGLQMLLKFFQDNPISLRVLNLCNNNISAVGAH